MPQMPTRRPKFLRLERRLIPAGFSQPARKNLATAIFWGFLSKGGARAKRPLERKGVIPLKRPRTGTGAPWVDPDDAPELTKEYFERADLYHGDKLIRRGRPPSENPKQAIKLRIDADVVEYFRATGPGWQTRINEALRRAAKLKRSA
jgi:uncharacterized protein (DUF4415 family)